MKANWFAVLALLITTSIHANELCVAPPPERETPPYECMQQVLTYLQNNEAAIKRQPSLGFNAVGAWERTFRKAYLALVAQGQTFSTPDAELIRSYIADIPTDLATDAAMKYAVERWFTRLGGVLAFISSAPIQGVTTYFTPSQTGSDLDQLAYANRRVYDKLAEIVMAPEWSSPSWRSQLRSAVGARIESASSPRTP